MAAFSPAGRVELVGGNARGIKAGGIAAGDRARRLSHAKLVAGGLRLRRVRGANYLYAIRRGRVKYVAVVSSFVARGKARVKEYASLLRKAKARQPAPVAAPAKAPIKNALPYTVSVHAAGAGLGYLCIL